MSQIFRQTDNEVSLALAYTIKTSMEPFKAKNVGVVVVEKIYDPFVTVRLTVETLPNWTFETPVDFGILMTEGPTSLGEFLGKKFAEMIRGIREPIGDHITLGED